MPIILANASDEIILENASGTEVWRLAYTNDETEERATFLEYSHDFCTPVTNWGSKTGVMISRSLNDPASGSLGYQGNNHSVDPFMMIIDAEFGSPLSGNYQVCAPNSIPTLSEWGLIFFVLLLATLGLNAIVAQKEREF